VPLLAGQRKGDEPDEVHDPDEEHQGGDIGEPAADRLGRQALLRDLHLRDLVDLLADRLAAADVLTGAHLPAHQAQAHEDREHRSDHQVDHGLGDREVEAAKVDRHPVVLLELGGRIELAARPGGGGECQGDRRGEQEPAPHLVGSFP
jgi:hypothetical protein